MQLTTELVARIDAWMQDAIAVESRVPDAMQLATVSPSGRPSIRTVLLKSWDIRGLVFYTNYASKKAGDITSNGYASILLHCKGKERQLIAEGRIERISAEESDTYFASRPRGSQLGAWASLQSEPLPERDELAKRVAAYTAKFEGGPVPRPSHWGGYRLVVDHLEFWQGMASRLHERDVYSWRDGEWVLQALYP